MSTVTTSPRKSTTDAHWNSRAASVQNDIEVNIMDVFQRELEYDYVCRYLRPEMSLLEVGCGNGYSTERFRKCVKHVDAFDYAENMIERAQERVGPGNNRFFHDNLLEPSSIDRQYDAVVCVRVLINLRNLQEQKAAVRNLARFTKPGGRLILAEGFKDGFTNLNALRGKVGLPAIEPAKINSYCQLAELQPTILESFELEDTFHLGAYDFLTRVVYPKIVGAENALHNTNFSESCAELARQFNPNCFDDLSRMKGLVLKRKV